MTRQVGPGRTLTSAWALAVPGARPPSFWPRPFSPFHFGLWPTHRNTTLRRRDDRRTAPSENLYLKNRQEIIKSFTAFFA